MTEVLYKKTLWEDGSQKEVLSIEKKSSKTGDSYTLKSEFFDDTGTTTNEINNLLLEELQGLAKAILDIK